MDHWPKEHVSMTASYPLPIPQDEIVRNIFKNSLFWKKNKIETSLLGIFSKNLTVFGNQSNLIYSEDLWCHIFILN